MVTLTDVAKLAGVSASTVSRVVNQNGYVSEEIADRVKKAVVELDYRPNGVARSFRSKTTMTVGVVVADLTNLYFMEALRGVEEILSPEGYLLLIASANNLVSKEIQYCTELDRRRVDGIVLASAGASGPQLAKVFGKRKTVVLIDRIVERAQFDCVLDNNDEGVRLLVDYLLHQGHEHFGIVSGPQYITAGAERLSAFEKYLTQAGFSLPQAWRWIGDEFSEDYGYRAGHLIADLRERPSVVFCANNVLSAGLLTAFAERHVAVPDDISIVSYGAIQNGHLFRTTMTQIEQPARQTGRIAAERLLRRLRHEDSLSQEITRLVPKLSLGTSVKLVNARGARRMCETDYGKG